MGRALVGSIYSVQTSCLNLMTSTSETNINNMTNSNHSPTAQEHHHQHHHNHNHNHDSSTDATEDNTTSYTVRMPDASSSSSTASSAPIQYPTLAKKMEKLYLRESVRGYLREEFIQFVNEAREWIRENEELQKQASEGNAPSEEKQQEMKQKRLSLLRGILQLECKDVYSLPIFTMEFCKDLLSEIKFLQGEISKLGVEYTRPNSMNSYGLVLEEVGMREFWNGFVQDYFSVLGAIMSPQEPRLDDHHTFIVEYHASGADSDKNLDVHVDDSELTMNLCLGEQGFEGGNLFFRGHIERPHTYQDYNEYEHQVGKAIIHDGKQMHGALDLTKGERFNLILWARSKQFRQEQRHIPRPPVQSSADEGEDSKKKKEEPSAQSE